ncbi:MAG: MFS transporter [Chloroflexota bacterium]|nr:MFS transporter [Chloroflexota bacterium]MDP6509111.1 MFS transporter [Chloroflexota bacterium]MDP6758283.1 MFS transporter [Chloroflexota bacterium]
MLNAAPAEANAAPPRLMSRGFVMLTIALGLGVAGWMPTHSFLSVLVRDEEGGSVLLAAYLIMGIHSGGTILGLTAGSFIRRYGSKATFTLGLAGQVGFLVALAVVPDFRWAIPLGPIAGVFLAYHWTGMQAYLIEVAPAQRRGMASGIGSFVVVLSPGLSGLVLALITDERFTFALLASVLVALGTLVALVALPRQRGPTPRPHSWPREHLLGWPVRHVTQIVQPVQRSTLRAFGSLMRIRIILLAMIVRLTTSLSFAIFNLLAGPKLIDAGGGFESVGLFVFGGAIAGGVAQVLIGGLSDRFGRRRLLAVSVFIALGSSVAFGFVEAIPLLLVASSLHWFAQSAFQTLLVALIGDVAPHGETGRAMALQTSFFSLGMVIGAPIAGVLAVGYVLPAFLLNAGFLAVGLTASIFMPRIGLPDAERTDTTT